MKGDITGNKDAQMEWKYYWVKVVARYNVVIEGWPASVPFRNLSVASSPLKDLDLLLCRWRDGLTFWKNITAAKTDKLLEEMKQKGEVQEPIHRTRSDHRKKQKQLPDEDKDTEDEQD